MNTEVTSVTGKQEHDRPFGGGGLRGHHRDDSPLRHRVIIPEVLRTVPGVEVARINASAWAISIRGFNSRFANKLLVQIDGVAIYNPTQAACTGNGST